MNVFAHLAPDDLWPGLVTALDGKPKDHEVTESVPDPLWILAGDAQAVERAFADLERRSLIEPGEGAGSWRIHRLTQAVQRGLQQVQPKGLAEDAAAFLDRGGAAQAGDHQDWPAIAAALLAAGYPYYANQVENFPTCARLNPHVAALDARRGGAPATRAMDFLYNQAGTYYWALRQDRLALRYAIANLRVKQRRGVPATDVLMGTGWNSLAAELSNAGRPVWAERASARAVEIAEANPDTQDADRAVWLSGHGRHLQALAQHRGGQDAAALFDRARARFHQALRLARKTHGRHSREVGIRLNNLGHLHNTRGRPGAAAVLYRTALSIRRKVLPPGDTDLGYACNNLGALLLRQGKVAEARALLGEALEIFATAFAANPAHPDTLDTAGWLAASCLLDGDAGAAHPIAARHGLDMAEVEARAARIKAKWPP